MADIKMNDGSKSLTYTANDWFYMKHGSGEECHRGSNDQEPEKCVKNREAVNNLRNSTNILGATVTQYNDSKMLYNRELLFTVNMLIGIALLCYYTYLNQSAFPSPSTALKQMGDLSNSMGNTASSWSKHLSMAPLPPTPPK
jgi:hypothetical protein